MKKAIFAISFAALLVAAAPAAARASGISSFVQTIRVAQDGTLGVEEKVSVEFTDPRHGIYRDIPARYRSEFGNPFSLRVKVGSVTDASGAPVPYSLSREGANERVKIGDPNRYVEGAQAYVISYSVSRALLFLADQDQLYWNVISQPWGDLGIPAQTSAKIILPGEIAPSEIKLRCFTEVGSKADGNCAKAVRGNTAQFSVSGTPLTVVVGWPIGALERPTAGQKLAAWLADNGIIFFPIACFAALFLLWHKKGRDPKVGTIVVQYEPPAGVGPAELGVLTNGSGRKTDVSATIIGLAVKGHLEITEEDQGSFLGTKKSYVFTATGADRSGLSAYEAEIMRGIFGAAKDAGAAVSETELQAKFYPASQAAKKLMEESAVARGWFAKNPSAVRAAYMGAAVGYFFLIFFFVRGAVFSSGPAWTVSLILPGAFLAFFGYFMPARTIKGTEAYAQALGFKEFLSKADKYRLQWSEKEKVFEKYLPYAMVFGVVDKWAKAFEGLSTEPPSWYHGTSLNVWTPVIFANAIGGATDSFANVMMSAPSGRGGGGFGGGGFGGGGFGGGGGGSW